MDALGYAVYRARALNFHVDARQETPTPAPEAPAPVPKVVHFPQPVHTVKPYDLATIVANLQAAEDQLFTEVNNREFTRPTIGLIQEMVRKRYRLTKAELIGPSRRAVYALPRHIAMYLCCRYTMHSLPIIAKHFGDRDHTSALHGRDRIAVLRLTDEKIGAIVSEFEAELA